MLPPVYMHRVNSSHSESHSGLVKLPRRFFEFSKKSLFYKPFLSLWGLQGSPGGVLPAAWLGTTACPRPWPLDRGGARPLAPEGVAFHRTSRMSIGLLGFFDFLGFY